MKTAYIVTAVALAGVYGCGEATEEAPSERATVRDSAEVRIVENPTPETAQAVGWTLGGTPELTIGVVGGEDAYQLFDVRGVERLADGRVLIVNSGTNELRIFDSGGEYLLAVGGEGEGPGEFQRINWAGFYRGDSIAAFDGRLGRLSVFSPEGEFVRSVSTRSLSSGVVTDGIPSAQAYLVVEDFPDGSFLARDRGAPVTSADTTRVERPIYDYVAIGPDGGSITQMASLPGSESFIHFENNGAVSAGSLPFGRETHLTVVGSDLAVGYNDGMRVQRIRRDGSLVGIVSLQVEPRALSESEAEAHRAEQLSQFDANPVFREAMASRINVIPYPPTIPFHQDIIGDAEGYLWVKRFPDIGAEEGPSDWYIFDADGVYQGLMTTPAGFTVTQIGSDFMLGYAEDDLEVEYVQMYSLQRN